MSSETTPELVPAAGHTWSHAPFRRLIATLLLTRAGNYMQTVASGWLAFHLTGDPMVVGVVSFLALGPALLGSPLGGRLADRYCPRRLATGLSFLSAIGPLGLAVLAVTDSITLPALYLLTAVSALPYSVNQPVRSIVVPYSVPMGLRRQALIDVSAANNVAELVGAIIGGVVVQTVGPALPYLFNAGAHLLTATVLILSPQLQASCDAARAAESGGVLAALRIAARIPLVLSVLLGVGAFYLLVAPIESQMPTLAGDHSEGAAALGFLLAAVSVGSMVGNVAIRRLIGTGSATDVLFVGLGVAAASVLALGWSNTLVGDAVLLVGYGLGWELVAVSAGSTLQLAVPPSIAGRMVGVAHLMSSGLTALGALLVGGLFTTVQVDPSLRLVGLVALLLAVALPRLRRHGPAAD